MRLAIIGCGSWGSTIARRARQIEGVQVVAVIDADRKRAEAVAIECEASAWPSTDTLSGIDVTHAIVATPPGSGRLRQVKDLIAAGVRNLRIEKPVAIDLAEAREILEVCERAGVKATVGHTPLNDDAVPRIVSITEKWDAVSMSASRVGSRRPAHDVSVLHDLVVHDAALAKLVLGDMEMSHSYTRNGVETVELIGPRGHATLRAMYRESDAGLGARRTIFTTLGGGEWLEYDEVEGTLTHNGQVVWNRYRDPLGTELERWRDGSAFPLRFGVEVVEMLGVSEVSEAAS